jgi:fructokinase
MIRIGIDLGGTKIEVIALDKDRQESFRHRVPTPQGNYAKTIYEMVELVLMAERELGERGTVGVGTPGAISKDTGFLKNSNSTCLIGKPIQGDLEKLLGRAVRLSNDANCFALSETIDGAATGAKVVFGVIAGTGTGGGIVVNGKVVTGANAIAGEWGHNPLPWPRADELPGLDCYCGKKGCIETFLSGPGMSKNHERHTGELLNPEEILSRALDGSAICEDTIRQYEDRMARSLAQVINILDPDVIVLGGGISNIQRLYENVPGLWGPYVFSDRVDTKLLPPKHGDSSGVRGAALLWE